MWSVSTLSKKNNVKKGLCFFTAPLRKSVKTISSNNQEHPVVEPQSRQTLQVPFLTMRSLPQFGQISP